MKASIYHTTRQLGCLISGLKNWQDVDLGPSKGSQSSFFFKGESARNTRGLLRLIILCTIAAAAVASRLFSVIRFESIIHECMSID